MPKFRAYRLNYHETSREMDKKELLTTANYLNKLIDHIPHGLWALKDAVSFACIDIGFYIKVGVKCEDWDTMIEFVSNIPVVEDWEDEKLTHWMIHNKDYQNYMPI